VHRLDQDTSGAILVVTTPSALRPIQAIFRTHAIERRYLAVVEGVFATPEGRIDLPLVADRGDGRRGVARRPHEGVPAVTHYEVLERFGQVASLVVCRLETGRTHQIRIHLAELGHPVVGDRVYRPRRGPKFPVLFERQALHAQALGFVHPISHNVLRVQAPIPTDLAGLIAGLREGYGSL
jgi:23S rRNA pseudouridine1911/1915/1917 synthase